MATDLERELFASKVLHDLAQQASRLPGSMITGFLAMAGASYTGSLMVVGRAVNDWKVSDWPAGILPTALCMPDTARHYAKNVQASVAGNAECPMRWVTAQWGATEDYNTRRSAFWRAIRRIVQGLGIAGLEAPDWSSNLVWTNLYKLAPAGGGNPNNLLRSIQYAGCAELLNLEFNTYKPSRVLFLTDAEWAAPFLSMGNLQKVSRYHYVEKVGYCNGARCVVAAHPQGKPEEAWTHEVLEAFEH